MTAYSPGVGSYGLDNNLYDPVLIVLFVGFVALVALVIGVLISYGQHNDTMNSAMTQLESSLDLTVRTFRRFVTTVLSAVERFTMQLADFFESFLRNISAFAAQAIAFFSGTFIYIFRLVEQLGLQIAKKSTEMEAKFAMAAQSIAAQMFDKAATIPVDFGSNVVLSVVHEITQGIQKIFCFAYVSRQTYVGTFTD